MAGARSARPSPAAPVRERRLLLPVLAVAVLAISAAAVLVRSIPDASPLAIAFWRSAFVALALSPSVRRPNRSDALRIALAGAFLAAHFASWFASLGLTTVMRSTVLVCAAPIWACWLEWIFLGRRPPAAFWVGIGVAIPGVALLAGSGGEPATFRGDGLAVLGGLCGAAYWVLGRSVRQRVGIGTYGSLVCASAAALLLPAAIATDAPLWGFPTRSWLLLAALALGPQLLGHNGFNFALRFLPAATVSAFTLLEPVGATVLAAFALGEIPPPTGALGALLAVAGVGIATALGPRRDPAAEAPRGDQS